ncbi:MAG: 4Fe-4S dicluster domain-containing protein [Adlercreutzia equolifaciens]
MTCGHCENPACVANCPTGHAEGSGSGIVSNDKEKCIGCMTCEKSCPYGHPVQLDDGLSTSACSARTRTRRACRIRPAPRRARCARSSLAPSRNCGSVIPRA